MGNNTDSGVVRYYVLRAGKACVTVWGWDDSTAGVFWAPGNFRPSSFAMRRALKKLAEQRASDIGAYQGNATPYFWGTYPEARAAVEYLQKTGLLTFRGKKIEIEDVGPPFVAPTEDDLDYEFVEDRIY